MPRKGTKTPLYFKFLFLFGHVLDPNFPVCALLSVTHNSWQALTWSWCWHTLRRHSKETPSVPWIWLVDLGRHKRSPSGSRRTTAAVAPNLTTGGRENKAKQKIKLQSKTEPWPYPKMTQAGKKISVFKGYFPWRKKENRKKKKNREPYLRTWWI